MSIDRDSIALDVLLVLLPTRPTGVRAVECVKVAYEAADAFLSESERPVDESYTRGCDGLTVLLAPGDIATDTFQEGALAKAGPVIDTDEGQEIDASYTVIDTADTVDTVDTGELPAPDEITAALLRGESVSVPAMAPDTESKAARTKRIKAEALEIYKAYPRKDNKVKAIEAIFNAIAGKGEPPWPFVDLLRRVRQYAQENPPIPRSHPDYNTKHPLPSTWINQRRFEDEHFDEGAAEDVTTNRFLNEDDDAR